MPVFALIAPTPDRTIAQVIAARFDNDGQTWANENGNLIATLQRNRTNMTRYDDGAIVHSFTDGSAIVTTAGGWDCVVPHLGGWATLGDDGAPDPTAWTFPPAGR